MSTRCQVIIYKDGRPANNFYHHCDGYPEYMGTLLYRIAGVAEMASDGIDNEIENIREMLSLEGGFENEDLTVYHPDVDYIWYIIPKGHGERATVEYVHTCWNSDFKRADDSTEDADTPEYEKIRKLNQGILVNYEEPVPDSKGEDNG